MRRFCVDKTPRRGVHEVHDLEAGCEHLPAREDRLPLGWHDDAQHAVTQARGIYPKVGLCEQCADASHAA
jgi:hypothetical protein